MSNDEISRFLERYGRALSTGDLPAIANCWAVPALVLGDEDAVAVGDSSEIQQFFAQATASYHAQGLISTRPELERVERLSEQLTAVDVRWAACDAAGKEQASERSHYVLQRGQEGELHVRVALTRTM